MTPSVEAVFGVRGAMPPIHPVKIYEDDEGLAKAVVEYVGEGIRRAEIVLVVATPPHAQAFAAGLGRMGIDARERTASGQLVVLDAQATLARFMSGESPNPVRFEEVITKVMDAASERRPGAPIRAYGEMVDLLWQEGRLEAALRLEGCWQELMEKRPFSLLCGYKVSVLDSPGCEEALEKICACHTSLIPAFDAQRLEAAVDRAIEAVLGEARARLLRPLIAADVTAAGLGRAEKAVLWVRRNLADDSGAILDRARRCYEKGV